MRFFTDNIIPLIEKERDLKVYKIRLRILNEKRFELEKLIEIQKLIIARQKVKNFKILGELLKQKGGER